ncbi:MAG: acyl-CoA dehydrogenase family protein [Lautropia sp.]|nr:acyl-CoA dehydrogenase family protein [Lautropia sp.]
MSVVLQESAALERNPVLEAVLEGLERPDPAQMLAQVREIAQGELAALADAIDRQGVYPEEVLRALGEAGAYQAQLGSLPGGANYVAAIDAIAEVARVCGSTGFLMWCQMACAMYLERSGNADLQEGVLPELVLGEALGGTGLSNAMKNLHGIEKNLLQARRDGEDFIVDGMLPWVSNLGDDHHFCAMAVVETADGPRELMFAANCADAGIETRPCPTFSGLEGTRTLGLAFSSYRVRPSQVVAWPARPFIAGIRSAFVLLQCGIGWGVTQGAIDSMREVDAQLGHVNRYLDEQPDDLQAELDALKARTRVLAATPYDNRDAFFVEVLKVRGEAAELALKAAQAALLHHGARGYLMRSPVQRRVRESHFVAIVTPATKHIRKEIARLQAAA